MRSILSVFKKKSPITLSIFALISLSNQTIPLLLPLFRPKIVFPGCLCSCSLLRKRKKSENRDFSKKPINTDFFTYFPPSCKHIGHLSPYRYEVGWVFVFEVALFYHTSKALFFSALPPLNHFCNKKEDFPHF